MIDWARLLANALWVIGLAIVLATLSHASFRAQAEKTPFRTVIARPMAATLAWSGLSLFAAGLALTPMGSLWRALLWWALVTLFATRATLAYPRRRQAEHTESLSRRLRHGVRPVVVGLVTLGVIMAALYALVILPWMQPDEPRHYEVVLHVARLGKPVVTVVDRVPEWEQDIIAAMEGRSFWWYGYSIVGWDPNHLPGSFAEVWGPEYAMAFYQPPLYYALMGGLLSVWGNDLGFEDGILRLRLAGLALFALSLLGIYYAVAELFPERQHWALGVLGLAALWPSHLAANASVNPEVLAEVLVVWALYFAVNVLRRGPRPGNVFWLVVLALLGFLTKRTALTASVIVPLTFLLWMLDASSGYRTWRKAVWIVLVVVIPLAVGLLLVQMNTVRVLPADFFAKLSSGFLWRNLLAYPLAEHSSSLLRTFMGWFGWMRVALPQPLYWLGAGLLILAVLGVARLSLMTGQTALSGWQKRALLLFAIALLVQLMFVVGKQLAYADFLGEPVPQMRYLYPVAPAIFLFLWLGWRVWVPRRLRRTMMPVSMVLLMLFNAYVLGFLLYPFYWL